MKKSTFMIELLAGLTEKLCTDISSTFDICATKTDLLSSCNSAAKAPVFNNQLVTDVAVI